MNKLIIGVPCKNDLKSIQMMIDSLFNSTNCFDELIFVDGDSTDGTREWLQYLNMVVKKVTLIKANTKSPLDAYNWLFDEALKQEADLFLTQTDVVFPKFL